MAGTSHVRAMQAGARQAQMCMVLREELELLRGCLRNTKNAIQDMWEA